MCDKKKKGSKKSVKTVSKNKISNAWLTLYSFPKLGVSVYAKDMESAVKKVKIIEWYKNKAI